MEARDEEDEEDEEVGVRRKRTKGIKEEEEAMHVVEQDDDDDESCYQRVDSGIGTGEPLLPSFRMPDLLPDYASICGGKKK